MSQNSKRQTDRQRWRKPRAEQRVEEPGTQQCPLVARPGGRPWILILQRAHVFRAVLPASSCGEVRLGVGHCPALDPTRCPPCHNKGQVSALHSEVSPPPPPLSRLSSWLAAFWIISVTDIQGGDAAKCQLQRPRPGVGGGIARGLGVQFKACVGRQAGGSATQLSQSRSGTPKPSSPTLTESGRAPYSSYTPDFSAYTPSPTLSPKPRDRSLRPKAQWDSRISRKKVLAAQ